MIRRTMCLVTAVLAGLLVLGAGPVPTRAHAVAPTALELHTDRPTWRLKERMTVTGRLTAAGQPIGEAPVHVGVDGYLDETPYRTTTAPDGTFRLEFWVEDWWGFGGHTLIARFPGNEAHAESRANTMFQVAPDHLTPVALTVDPVPAPVTPGERVRLTGTLRNDRNEAAPGHSIIAVVNAATETRAFGRVRDDAGWAIDFTVPTAPGEWSETFPEYRVPVVFEGDWWLAPARAETVLTLTRVPTEAPPTPAPTSSALQVGTPAATPTPTAVPGPTLARGPAAPPGPLPAWMPRWVASPLFLLGAGAFLAVLLGATFVSHGRRGE